jgi:hypothetical protein
MSAPTVGEKERSLINKELDGAAEGQMEAADAKICASQPSTPIIIVTGRPFHEYADETKTALEKWNQLAHTPKLYRRSGKLVTLVDKAGRMIIEQIELDELRLMLSRAANYHKAVRDGYVLVTAPPILVSSVMSRRDLEVPELAGVVESPVLRSDGSILQEPGYDGDTHLFYHPAAGLGTLALPEHPTATELEAALQLVDEAITDFPFEDSASKANAIAMLLTALARPAIDGCVPMAVISGTNPGVGKGLLASVASMIATGAAASVETVPATDEEFRKKITSQLRTGRAFIVWDNVRGTVQSTALEAVLTGRFWSDRLLGTNDVVEVQQKATWIMTGKNVSLGTDIARRCYQIRLVSPQSRPWQQDDFKHPRLLEWVTNNRAELLGALLTLAAAWFDIGRPEAHIKPLGSFEEWSRVIGGMLENAGVEGFLDNLEDMYASTTEEERQWEEFLAAIKKHSHGNSFTIAELAKALPGSVEVPANAIQSALPEAFLSTSDPRQRLGKAFSSRVGTKYGPDALYLERDGQDSHSKAARWRVRAGKEEKQLAAVKAA